ncbi:M24 family metallopeptidase [Halobellus salinisoli]|uniref:M24 family metallopeptidase n=1 Tax=Halobellus salinisoli TaxID=3108500 RepID=UPI00300B9149
MKSREPVLVHGRDYWDEINLPATAFADRIDQIRGRMTDEGVDVLLVYGRGDRDGDLCYVSNLVNKVPNWGLLVCITHDHVSVRNERSSRTRPVIERGTWIDDIQFCDNVLEDLDDVLGAPENRIGTAAFDRLPYQQRSRFETHATDYDIVAFDDALADLRAAKSRQERDQIARAGRIAADVHEALDAVDRNDVSERDLAGEADYRARLRGAQDVRFLVSNPARTEADLRPAEERRVDADEPIGVYTAVRFEGYWAECARTLRLDGEAPHAEYSDVTDAYAAFLESITPGTTASQVVDQARSAASELGWELSPEYDVLHGIGLEADEAPIGDDEAELTAGMTVSARLALRPDADSLLVLNDTLALRNDGPDVLTGDW